MHGDDGENRAECVDLFFIDIAVGFDRHVAACQAGATCADHHVDGVIRAPCTQLIRDQITFIGQDMPCGDDMASALNPRHQRVAGTVVAEVTGV